MTDIANHVLPDHHYEMTEQKQQWIDDLRAFVDFLEANPVLIDVYDRLYCSQYTPFIRNEAGDYIQADAKTWMAEMARALGKADKATDSAAFSLVRKFGVHRIEVRAPRDQVCEATVVGTETKTVTKVVTPAVTEEVEEQVDIIEWVCPESILRP